MKTITAKEFDEKFDNGEDISEYLDFSKAIRPNALKTDTKKVMLISLSGLLNHQIEKQRRQVLQDNPS